MPAHGQHGLTPRQAAAVRHFLTHGCMTAAYRHAYSTANMKPATVNRRAIDLFQKPAVAARVEQLRAQTEERAALSRHEALGILAEIARGTVAHFLDADGSLDISKVVSSGSEVQEFTEDTIGTATVRRRVKLASPLQAIERTAKMCGWDKQAALGDGQIVINLNMGDPPDE